jgi:hypothetical protein
MKSTLELFQDGFQEYPKEGSHSEPCFHFVNRNGGLSVIQFFIFPNQTGTATSSPVDRTTSPTHMNIVNVMLWMKRNAYEESTIRKVAKLLRHLRKNCNTQEPEEVKLYIANKTCGNRHKENLVEAKTRHDARTLLLFAKSDCMQTNHISF